MTSPAHPIPDFAALVRVHPATGDPPGDPAEVLAALLVEAWRQKQPTLPTGNIYDGHNEEDGEQ